MSSNTIKVLTAVSKEISRRFDVKADLINSVNRQYDKPHAAFGSNSGSTIEIKKPQKLNAVESSTLDIQDVVEQTASLAVNNDVHVGLGFTANELSQDLLNPRNMKMFADDYLESAIDNIIAKMQGNLYTYIQNNVYQSANAQDSGTVAYADVASARAKLNIARAPRNDRCIVMNPLDAADLNVANSGLFHAGDRISSQYKDGALSGSLGFAFKEIPEIGSHTVGTEVSATYTVNGASQTGATVTVATGTKTFTKGTILTFAGCFDVDPISGTALGTLKQFVVTADYDGAGNLPISPSIVTSGAYKNCSASPTNGGAVTTINTAASTAYRQNFALHRDSFVFGSAMLGDIGVKYEMPIITGGAGMGYSSGGTGAAKGVAMKLYMDGDITNRRAVARLDARYGYAALIPEWACAIQGDS